MPVGRTSEALRTVLVEGQLQRPESRPRGQRVRLSARRSEVRGLPGRPGGRQKSLLCHTTARWHRKHQAGSSGALPAQANLGLVFTMCGSSSSYVNLRNSPKIQCLFPISYFRKVSLTFTCRTLPFLTSTSTTKHVVCELFIALPEESTTDI